ncbi:AEL_collapsed_G0005250.mRNA.1.CDS.1 [Saccharomyces cerevisiae]|nr:ATV_HP_G0103170.mRNA.1.CDS.1 [Saccharomyces cerevisiae]CAI5238688.1 AAC_HP2_G0005070.mRNA.1.CDS.1 [Saccharomyces cerevisiae]CAI6406355.1 AAC_HP1_G0005230.mRNA.1.CDS.1 [Saccharomyces cerevisiae]CAI6407068.1 AAC_HP2_G0005070.mRNA.1.CDS.1 [Saccharomyces cerevisiae]CAI6409082.1 AEL_HP1_G0005190.mRNA.1.CDS.1 [Saccharomyces cerevisiae]
MGIEDISAIKNGFIVVPFKLPDHKALPKSQEASLHFMFAKRHQSSNSNESDCLFLVNLPLLSNIEHMKKFVGQLCGKYDTVSHVEELLYNDEFGLHEVDLSALTSDLMSSTDVNEKRYTPRNTALLKFVDAASINNCWNALKKYSNLHAKHPNELFEWTYTTPSFTTFVNFYKPLDIDYLKEDIHTHMAIFEQREAQAQEDVQSSIVDEDGFTLVVGKNTKSLNSIRKKILNKNPLSKHENKAKPISNIDKKAKKDFYRFQVRERKKQEINQLLSKFKEDQERIKVMKAKRKFNPYT